LFIEVALGVFAGEDPEDIAPRRREERKEEQEGKEEGEVRS
jgi:hypothetical protein